MAPRKSSAQSDPDRFIVSRGGTFHYKRRVPAVVASLDDRAPHVRISLKTSDIAAARQKRDAFETADNALWEGMLSGDPTELSRKRYETAVSRAEALGFAYRPAADLALPHRLTEVVHRLEAIADERTPPATSAAVLGTTDRPKVMVTAAFQRYLDEIAPAELAGKSEEQKRQWKKVKRRAINNFVEINGDMPIEDVAREHGIAVFDHWAARIVPPRPGKATHSASSGNRDLGNLRGFYRDYFTHLGERDRKNPFDDLSFRERQKKRRPPFSTDWLKDKIMAPGALADLNDDARGCILGMIETGMRPSEIANIGEPGTIVLDHAIPHVIVQPREDPDDPREIKTANSERMIPLVGVSLAVFKAHPKGFPRYREREASLSAAVNKFLWDHGLRPTKKHVLYSVRHAFEDRMKNGGVDAELRKLLMGHDLERPAYGEGGSLQWRYEALKSIALPFDASIV